MRRDGCRDSSGCRARSNRVRSRWKRCLENVAGQKNAYAVGSLRDHLTTFDDACTGTRLFAAALPLGLMASRLTHSCAYPCLRLCFILAPRCGLGQPGAAVPTQMSEVEGSVLPTLACSSNRACSSSLDDGGRDLPQRRCGRAALLGPRSGAMSAGLQAQCRRSERATAC